MDRNGFNLRSPLCGMAVAGLLTLLLDTRPAVGVSTIGACCPSVGPCVITSEETCLMEAGTYGGDGTLCSDIECDQHIEAPVLSVFGLVGLLGSLGGWGFYRLARRRRA